nr:hypothetical protein [Heyndrickxia oleronia]
MREIIIYGNTKVEFTDDAIKLEVKNKEENYYENKQEQFYNDMVDVFKEFKKVGISKQDILSIFELAYDEVSFKEYEDSIYKIAKEKVYREYFKEFFSK